MKSLLKIAFVVTLASLIAACGPQGNKNNAQGPQTQSQNMTDQTVKGHGHKLRKVCADEIQKYCADGTKVRKCLQQNIDKLGDRCKTRLNEVLERRRERKELRGYNATHQQGQQTQPTGTTPQGQMQQPQGQMQQQPQGQMQQQAQPNKTQSSDDDDDDE